MEFTNISHCYLILDLLKFKLLLLFLDIFLLLDLLFDLLFLLLLSPGLLFFQVKLSVVVITGMLLLADLGLEVVVVNGLARGFAGPP